MQCLVEFKRSQFEYREGEINSLYTKSTKGVIFFILAVYLDFCMKLKSRLFLRQSITRSLCVYLCILHVCDGNLQTETEYRIDPKMFG